MAKRVQLKNIANGIISSFISRNNDLGGYWAIGKLYSFMLSNQSMEIEIDLTNGMINPSSQEFAPMVSFYKNKLYSQIEKAGFTKFPLKEAKIYLTGFPNKPTIALGQIGPNQMTCKILIINDLGEKHQIEKQVYCRPHDPNLELKSVRYKV